MEKSCILYLVRFGGKRKQVKVLREAVAVSGELKPRLRCRKTQTKRHWSHLTEKVGKKRLHP